LIEAIIYSIFALVLIVIAIIGDRSFLPQKPIKTKLTEDDKWILRQTVERLAELALQGKPLKKEELKPPKDPLIGRQVFTPHEEGIVEVYCGNGQYNVLLLRSRTFVTMTTIEILQQDRLEFHVS